MEHSMSLCVCVCVYVLLPPINLHNKSGQTRTEIIKQNEQSGGRERTEGKERRGVESFGKHCRDSQFHILSELSSFSKMLNCKSTEKEVTKMKCEGEKNRRMMTIVKTSTELLSIPITQ